jgi:hypothetical protein
MSILLKDLVEEWKRVPEYTDVEAEYWEPNQPQVETCPHGCDLMIYEDTPTKWARISGRDVYRQTRICREHGFARIYIITGPTAQAHNWTPKKD